MPIIIACPTCRGQLRVSDDLIGRKVRCPACNTTFDAAESAPAPPPPAPEAPVETVPLAPWKNLNLELASDSPESPPRSEPPLKGAVEIEHRSEPPLEPAGRREREERRPPGRDAEDLRSCPGCGKMIHRDSSRCYSCGERFDERPRRSLRVEEDEDEDRPRRPRRPRRDCEPHRGGLILTFGIISVASLFVCWPLAPVALGFGIAAWWMGGGDLRKIRAGAMDPDGEGTTQAGWICGIVGVCINGLVVLGCGGFFGYTMYDGIQQAKTIKRQPFAPPPPSRKR